MPKINLYENIINNKKVCLDVSKYNNKISECSIFNQRKFAFIGISLGNSYFNEERLELIIRAFSTNFERVAVFLVDDISEHNYRAMGYDEKKIKKKIRQKSNNTKNKILRSIDKTNKLYSKGNIEFYKWDDIENFEKYHNYLKKVLSLYKNSNEFKFSIDNATKKVIEKYLYETNNISNLKLIDEAKLYLIKELALAISLNEFFDEDDILTCYYQDFKLYREFLEKHFCDVDEMFTHDCLIYDCY